MAISRKSGVIIMAKILVFGEILWDVFDKESFIGGAPLNFAAHSKIFGAQTALISAIGNDKLGEETKLKIKEYGINDRMIQCLDEFRTGVTLVTLKNGQPDYKITKNVAFDNISYSDELQKKINNFAPDCFYFGTVSQRGKVSAQTLKSILKNTYFKHIFCDLNLRKDSITEETINFSLENSTILKINREEKKILEKIYFEEYSLSTIEFSKLLCKKFSNLKLLIITLDKDGAYIYNNNTNSGFIQETSECKIVSATGAGDAFCAAFMTNYLTGKSLEECAKKATKIANYVLGFKEAIPPKGE